MNYKLAYRLGFHPWEDLAEHPPFAEKLLALIAREESDREPPYGPALDLGCGSGVWGGGPTGRARLAGHKCGHRRQGPPARTRASPRSRRRRASRAPDVTNFASPHERIERLDGFLDGRDPIPLVHIIEIDDVSLEALQARLRLSDDVVTR